jgi:hypothetical protein
MRKENKEECIPREDAHSKKKCIKAVAFATLSAVDSDPIN